MSRGRLAFKETDVARAIRGARKGGMAFPRIEIGRDGRIVIMDGLPPQLLPDGPPPADGAPDLDAELEAWQAEHGGD
jgi:hypothetical protein